MKLTKDLHQAVDWLKQGKILSYPTEAVFGLGCDPFNEQALQNLLTLKNRDPAKGLIVIAHNFDLLKPFIDLQKLNANLINKIQQKQPTPTTWIVPCADISSLITGNFNSVAVRICLNNAVADLCENFGRAIISTSANLSGNDPCKDAKAVAKQLKNSSILIFDKETNGFDKPSIIKDLISDQIFRL